MITLEVKSPDGWLQALADKAFNTRTILKLIGIRVLSFIDKQFQSSGAEGGSPWQPLKPSTLALRARGGNQPLRDNGTYSQSFTSQIESDSAVWVGSKSQIGPYHEFGTSPYTITARKKILAAQMRAGGWMIFGKTVHHPGLPIRAVFPSGAVVEKIITEEVENYVENALVSG